MSEPTELTVAITLLRQRIGAELVADIIAKIRTALDGARAEGERRGREAAAAECFEIQKDLEARHAVNEALVARLCYVAIKNRKPDDTITSLDVLARIERETTGEGE